MNLSNQTNPTLPTKPSLPLAKLVENFLDQNKAEDIFRVKLEGKSIIADDMVIASGSSGRFLKALAEKLKQFFHQHGVTRVRIEGEGDCDWVLVDTGDIIVHLFRPEVREEYNLERMWQANITDGNEPLVS